MEQRSKKGSIAVIIGTRPEGIKLCPLILRMHACGLGTCVIRSGQHGEMLAEVLSAFSVSADISLPAVYFGEDLPSLLSHLIASLGKVLQSVAPPLVIVQGDTATAYAGALAAFLLRIPILHVEAGLRSRDPFSPFPEESFRKSIASMASLHIAPSPEAMMHLWQEGVEKRRVFLYGNTVEDALRHFLPKNVRKSKNLLLTLHRREHSEQALRGIFSAVRALLERFSDHSLVYPVHPSPRVRSVAEQMLGGLPRISLLPPLAPPAFYPLLAAAPLVLTDSGGIQEEAALLGVPTLVLREQTERESELLSGRICLAGTDPNRIFSLASALLSEPQIKRKESLFGSPSARICKLLLSFKEFGFDMQRLFR